jgi:hypothetical protein
MVSSSERNNSRLARSYRLKLSTVALVVFLVIAFLVFYLRAIGIIGDVEYYVGLVSLIIAALIVTIILGRMAKKRYASSAS